MSSENDIIKARTDLVTMQNLLYSAMDKEKPEEIIDILNTIVYLSTSWTRNFGGT